MFKKLLLLAVLAAISSPVHAQNDTRIRAAVASIRSDLANFDSQPDPSPYALIAGIGRRMTRLGEKSFDAYLKVITRSFNTPRDVVIQPDLNIFSYLRTLPAGESGYISSNLFGLGAGVDTPQEALQVRNRLSTILGRMGANQTRRRAILRRVRATQLVAFRPPLDVSRN
ncbi:hypothetical protein [Acuticoccus sp. I52.16.1]|uniref:hypothetical protein n=1 Tax=Acuticoccus sp. I52.16.1 TaxID=2928472 RepID=UPI001FD1F5FC|nr:hypothetical protein [Acuticoccus sp. I52.16.1]UOM35864.1 hypothetical protein MRB58_06590 [Acuticoccus sp. I52.16.1]